MNLEGRVWIFKDENINTDLIYPGKYTYEPFSHKEQAEHAMEDYDPGFSQEVKQHDIIVAGKNFGCGSSREQAVTCLKYSGIDAIITDPPFAIYGSSTGIGADIADDRMVRPFFEASSRIIWCIC